MKIPILILFSFSILFIFSCNDKYYSHVKHHEGNLDKFSYVLDYSHGKFCKAKIKLTNNYANYKSVNLRIIAYDKDKVNIDEVDFYFNNIPPGGTILRERSFFEFDYCDSIKFHNIVIKQ